MLITVVRHGAFLKGVGESDQEATAGFNASTLPAKKKEPS